MNRISRSTPSLRPVGAALLIAGLVLAASDAAAQGLPTPGASYACQLCGLFEVLTSIGLGDMSEAGSQRRGLGAAIYRATFEAARNVAGIIAMFAIIWSLLISLIDPSATAKFAKKTLEILLVALVLSVLYSSVGVDALFAYVFDPVQQIGAGFGAWIIQVGITNGSMDPVAITYNGAGLQEASYSYLWAHVEQVVFKILYIVGERIEASWAYISTSVILWVFLSIPYVFVAGIFGAFLIQAIFYTVAIAAVLPFLFLGLFFGVTRQMVWASLRFLAGAVMTVIFASAAMAYTAMALNHGLAGLELWLNIGNAQQQLQAAAVQIQQASCSSVPTEMGTFNCTMTAAEAMAEARSQLPMIAQSADRSGGRNVVLSPEYWFTFLLGFISALLHLAAPRIASNISGAQDSATSAAVVVAAGQMMGARAMTLGARALAPVANVAGRGAGGAASWGLSRARTGLSDGLSNWMNRGS